MPVLKYWNGSAYVELSPGNFQPLDSDLTAIAAIAPANDDFIQRKTGVWVNRTVAQVKTDLALTKGDVGLGSVDNTADTAKPVSTAQQTALNLKIDLTQKAAASGVATLDGSVKVPIAQVPTAADGVSSASLVPLANDSRLSNARTPSAHNHTAAEIASGVIDLARLGTTPTANEYLKATGASGSADWVPIDKTTVGLGNVDNTSDVNKPLSTAESNALANKAALTHAHAAADVTSGVMDVARLGSSPAAGRLLTALAAGGSGSWVVADKSVVGLGNVDNLQQQPLDSDLTAIAALATQPYGRSLLTTADASALHTALGDLPTLAPVRVSSGLNSITLSGTQTIDGVACVAGDRVLVRWNGPATQNGIYVVAAGAWSRAADADTAAKIQRGTRVLALEGNADKWKVFTQTQTLTTLGTDNVEWRLHNSVDVAGSLQAPGALNDGHIWWDRNAKSLAAWEFGWTHLNGMRICTSSTRPLFPGDDACIYETDTGNAYIYSGGWKPLGAVVVEDQNATPREVSKIDFQGAGVGVSAGAAGEAIVTIPGGAASAGDNWVAGTGVPSGPNVLTRTNLVTNPSAEVNTTDWSLIYSPISSVLSRSTAQARNGSACLAETSASDFGGGTMGIRTTINAVTAGTTYTGSCYVRAAVTSRSGYMTIDWRNSLGASISITIGDTISTSAGAWSRWWVAGVAPAGAVSAVLNIYWTSVGVSEAHYADSVLFEAASATSIGTVGAYFDGATTDTSTDIYDWLGTANNSTSTRSGPVPVGTWYEDTLTRLVYEMTDASGVWTLRGGMNVTTEPDWGAYTNDTGTGPTGSVTGTALKVPWPSAMYRGAGVTATADNGLRVAKAGVYRLQTDLTIQSGNAGWVIIEIRVYRAAALVKTFSIVGGNNTTGGFGVFTVHGVTDLLAGDIAYVYATTSAGGSNGLDSRSQFTCHQIATSAATSGDLVAGFRGTAAQAVGGGAYVGVLVDSTPDHTCGGVTVSGSVVTVATAGVYQFHGQVQYQSIATAFRVALRIEGWTGTDPGVGSATELAGVDITEPAAPPGLEVSGQAFLQAGHKLRLVAWQSVAGTLRGSPQPQKLNIRKISQGAAVGDTGFLALPLSTGWTPQGGAFEVPRYRRLGDIVYIEGMPLHGTTGTAQIGILPVGFRPQKTRYFPTRYWTGSAVGVGTFSIGNDGAITMEQFVNNSTSNLDGVSFSVL